MRKKRMDATEIGRAFPYFCIAAMQHAAAVTKALQPRATEWVLVQLPCAAAVVLGCRQHL